ncbi:MAG: hypothetical protein HQ553_04375, partial [Chloroflexi bacterium]|nr:hypothetical protein [Chloroflexota bacterium]
VGTVYGNVVTFTTDEALRLPAVTSEPVTNVGTSSATADGIIMDLGNPNPTAHGFVWNISGTPTIADNLTDSGTASATGAFSSALTSLTPNTTHYVRAYATNAVGTTYGNEVMFITGALPAVITEAVTDVSPTAATGNGTITDLGNPNPTAHGIVWNTSGTPMLADNFTDEGVAFGTGTFTSSMTGLSSLITYYVRAYATNDMGTSYGEQTSFTTTGTPSVITDSITEVQLNSATANGTISNLGNPDPIAYGAVWNTSGLPTVADSLTDEGPTSTTGFFASLITGLSTNTTYYVRAYATNVVGTAYGEELSFTTTGTPMVTTEPVTNVGTSTAMANASFTVLGNPNPTSHGVVWNTTGTPTLVDNSTDEGPASVAGPFTTVMNGLTPNTTYYVRAYAINAEGTAYGNEVSYTTHAIAAVTTEAVSDISTTTATGNGTIIDLGNPNPTAYGVVWNTLGTPTLADGFNNEGPASVSGSFTSIMTGLMTNTTYYVRAYVTNSAGTVYGEEVSFTTTELPSVITLPPSDIRPTRATLAGTIMDLGNPNPTAHGFVWNTSGSPTLADDFSDEGPATATGDFTSILEKGLAPKTTYYVRAYATNAAGTVYGNEISFVTSPQ